MCVTWLICACEMTHCVWHGSSICVTWLVHTNVKRRVHVCDVTHSYVWHDSFAYVVWLIQTCDTTHSCVWHDPFFLDVYDTSDKTCVHVCVTWLVRMCGISRTNGSCHTHYVYMMGSHTPYMHDIAHSYVMYDIGDMTHYVTWRFHIWRMCDPTHSYMIHAVWHESLICVTWLIDLWSVWHDSLISEMCVTWLTLMSYECQDMVLCVTWLDRLCGICFHTCDMTHLWAWHDSFTCVTWLILSACVMSVKTCSCVWRDSFVCAAWLVYAEWQDSFICVTWLIHINDVTHVYVWHDVFTCVIRVFMCVTCEMTYTYVRDKAYSYMRYRVAKTHRIPYLYRSFSAKVTYI